MGFNICTKKTYFSKDRFPPYLKIWKGGGEESVFLRTCPKRGLRKGPQTQRRKQCIPGAGLQQRHFSSESRTSLASGLFLTVNTFEQTEVEVLTVTCIFGLTQEMEYFVLAQELHISCCPGSFTDDIYLHWKSRKLEMFGWFQFSLNYTCLTGSLNSPDSSEFQV